jgi:anti-anti-sigma regulatory factor
MQIMRSRTAGHTVLRPVGALSVATAPRIRLALAKALAEGDPVVVDLGGFTVDEPAAVAVFTHALQTAGGWPGASLVLFGADALTARALTIVSIPVSVPLVDDLPAALVRAARRPDVIRRSVALGPDVAAVDTARRSVRDVCDAWTLRAVSRESAVVVVAELVANAVAHAGGPTTLGLEHNGRRLWLRVRDPAPALPHRQPAPLGGVGTRGLDVVERVASGWGTTPHPEGKTVWAWLRATPAPPAA